MVIIAICGGSKRGLRGVHHSLSVEGHGGDWVVSSVGMTSDMQGQNMVERLVLGRWTSTGGRVARTHMHVQRAQGSWAMLHGVDPSRALKTRLGGLGKLWLLVGWAEW